MKGIPLLVDAWSGDPALHANFNLVVVGGGLESPTPEEQLVLDEIAAVCRRRPTARDGLVLLGHWPNSDVSQLLEVAVEGIPGVVAPGGVYACASRKEEFGLALLEALAAGLSAVGPSTGGPRPTSRRAARGSSRTRRRSTGSVTGCAGPPRLGSTTRVPPGPAGSSPSASR